MNRKSFLKSTGHLLLGFNLLPFTFCTSGASSSRSAVQQLFPIDSDLIDAWIRLDTTGFVTIFTGKMELGQGIKTALKQIAAEELDVSIERVRIVIADTGQTPDERYTAGSGSIEGSGMAIRKAAAEARQVLLHLAAEKLKSPIEKLAIYDGNIQLADNEKHATTYWDVLRGEKVEGKITGKAPLKHPNTYKLVGKAEPRDDLIAMATGTSFYVHDMKLPEMLHARVIRPPSYKAILTAVPEETVMAMAGVVDLVKSGNFLAVLAQEEYTAVKAWHFLRKECKWKVDEPLPDQARLYDDMLQYTGERKVVEELSDSSGNTVNPSKNYEALYKRPYHMHASIGPSCAIAQWQSEQLTVWTHSQGVYPLRKTLADLLSVPEEKIRAIGVPGSGCYGHNGADDVATDAALIAYHVPGKPIRLQWMREDEHQWEPYGSAMIVKIQAALKEDGKIDSWQTNLWSDTHSTRPSGRATHTLTGQQMDPPRILKEGGISGGAYRNATPYYEIPNIKITAHAYEGPLRTSALRSLGAYANIFALESFIDELAFLAKKDPLDFRLEHLADPRAIAVIKAVAKKVNWNGLIKNPKVGYGLAFAKYKNHAAYFAVVAEVQIDEKKQHYRLRKLTGAIDAGQAINPDGLKNQTEGGMIQSASWSMFEQVNYAAKGVTSDTWDTYPIMRFSDVPALEVMVLDRPEEPPLGAGEAAQGPTAAAIANAIYDITHTRIRELPLTPEKINWS
ncbi:xanthine dehydrogenase family protein molybdopterin-binding subunit [Olivibacter sp. SDN3]|uniref:xanthine dehydrogenase family protein molybdopterin-binding subunit n=1 Tax=Olivibacter sp. SDN3 TaxID=2764720 RepID=UPI0016515064|nr:molybdopterin cofactor-binding domain-containing protein [Olivibacter sp. SDN3]QNL50931.1 xanthine dehydrogenase family protein molybdopterin-binding subunit [Olivibacter sp. SDN3]